MVYRFAIQFYRRLAPLELRFYMRPACTTHGRRPLTKFTPRARPLSNLILLGIQMGSGMGAKKRKNHYIVCFLYGVIVWFLETHLSWRNFYTCASTFCWSVESIVCSPSTALISVTGRAFPINIFKNLQKPYIIDPTPTQPLFNQLWKVSYTNIGRARTVPCAAIDFLGPDLLWWNSA